MKLLEGIETSLIRDQRGFIKTMQEKERFTNYKEVLVCSHPKCGRNELKILGVLSGTLASFMSI